jgi:hypothetical protein
VIDKNYSLGRAAIRWLKDALDAQETGGLSWHMTAWVNIKNWQGTNQKIEQFLLSQKIDNTELLLIGGSAGWMMPTQWLKQFKIIKIIDIDPLAPIFFYLNHGKELQKSKTNWAFERRDGLRELPILIKESPNSFIWFDNVLGQQCFKLKDEEMVLRQLRHIKLILKDRNWGSIHDWLSGPIESALSTKGKDEEFPMNILSFPLHDEKHDWENQKLILNGKQKEFNEGTQFLLNQVSAKGEWQDHLSSEVFPSAQSCQLIHWFFKPKYCHFLIASTNLTGD